MKTMRTFLGIALTGLVFACSQPPEPSLVLVTIAGWPAEPEEAPPNATNLEGFLADPNAWSSELGVAASELLPSEASLQTGRSAEGHGLVGAYPGERLRDDARTLAEAAKTNGMATAAFLAAPELAADNAGDVTRGFDAVERPAAEAGKGRAADVVVREAIDYLAARQPGERSYVWIQLDARDDVGGVGELGAVDDAFVNLLDALGPSQAERPTVLAVVGSIGEPRQAALNAASATRVRAGIRGLDSARAGATCGGVTTAIPHRLASAIGVSGIPCEAVEEAWSLAAARRFGLPTAASPPAKAVPPVSPELTAELAAVGLPTPSKTWQLVREGAGTEIPNKAVLDQELAALRQRAGGGASARALYERALTADPLALEAMTEMARLDLRAGRAPEAVARLRGALPSYRGRPEVYHALAHVSFVAGAYREALACAQVASLFTPDESDLSFDLAVNLAALGRHAEALDSLERAVELGFHDERLLLGIPQLQPLRGDPRFGQVVERVRAAS